MQTERPMPWLHFLVQLDAFSHQGRRRVDRLTLIWVQSIVQYNFSIYPRLFQKWQSNCQHKESNIHSNFFHLNMWNHASIHQDNPSIIQILSASYSFSGDARNHGLQLSHSWTIIDCFPWCFNPNSSPHIIKCFFDEGSCIYVFDISAASILTPCKAAVVSAIRMLSSDKTRFVNWIFRIWSAVAILDLSWLPCEVQIYIKNKMTSWLFPSWCG